MNKRKGITIVEQRKIKGKSGQGQWEGERKTLRINDSKGDNKKHVYVVRKTKGWVRGKGIIKKKHK